ncbi:uncharacterized protein MELLADRAFT_61225 [Melampsora larici-populina 98AG31]|uniref:Uncharacterized protein n=1 Tax=Melampsora larici-populina (strain 98AG31 / pathotype 3-4-7) TaxID=747676 RepID=F4RE29_MELLP|nr:uncharacterized protein MELLADRAFT_61225 [Melampsora larici-populina 98AG31]EGG09510.1 hypothetical protein MELLADRAFT_61225 [Melampsora larici-populina 98AG31]
MSAPDLPTGLENLPPRASTPSQSDSNRPRTRKGKKVEALNTVNEGEMNNLQERDGSQTTNQMTSTSTGNQGPNLPGAGEGTGGDEEMRQEEVEVGEDELPKSRSVGNITGIG